MSSEAKMATSTAGPKLVHTYELLEMILLALQDPKETPQNRGAGLRSIIAARRVSTTFRDIIANSSRIQNALFRRPPKIDAGAPDQSINHILCLGPQPSIEVNSKHNSSVPYVLHVMFRNWDPDIFRNRGLPANSRRHRYPWNASWRDMYLSDTRYQVAQVNLELIYPKTVQVQTVAVYLDNPRMGELFDAVWAKEWITKQPRWI